MCFLCGILVLLPHLDRLVRLAGDQPHAGEIESGSHDTSFRIQRTRLRNRVLVLESVAGLPVPESDTAVVSAREEHVILVDGNGVDDAVVTFEVLHEIAAWAEPLLDLTR